MAEDWDLSAVVRSCAATTKNSGNSLSCSLDKCFKLEEEDEEEDGLLLLPAAGVFVDRKPCSNELQDSYKPFLSPLLSPPSPGSAKHPAQLQERELVGAVPGDHGLVRGGAADSSSPPDSSSVLQKLLDSPGLYRTPARILKPEVSAPTPTVQPQPQQQQPSLRSRKRKSQQKRTVCHVTEENLSSDMWAWRKYGQKPIKGSPYPRNYYRCSSSKGCGARKQVERSNLDHTIFIVTYTGEHIHPRPTHRNSLAGSTRSKQPANPKPDPNAPHHDPTTGTVVATDGGNDATSCSPPRSLSPATPLKETENDSVESPNVEDEELDIDDDGYEDDDLLIPNLAARDREDDIFSGLGGWISGGGDTAGGGGGG